MRDNSEEALIGHKTWMNRSLTKPGCGNITKSVRKIAKD